MDREEINRRIADGVKRQWSRPDSMYKEAYKQFANDKSHMWKGDSVGYSGLHMWLRKYKKKVGQCSHCGTKSARKYEWANVSGEYRRDFDDFIELCTSCHRKYDYSKKMDCVT